MKLQTSPFGLNKRRTAHITSKVLTFDGPHPITTARKLRNHGNLGKTNVFCMAEHLGRTWLSRNHWKPLENVVFPAIAGVCQKIPCCQKDPAARKPPVENPLKTLCFCNIFNPWHGKKTLLQKTNENHLKTKCFLLPKKPQPKPFKNTVFCIPGMAKKTHRKKSSRN